MGSVPIFSKSVIFWPVVISVVGHIALISASSMIDLHDKPAAAEIFTVDIKEPDLSPPAKNKEKRELKDSTKAKAGTAEGWREETVDLGSNDVKYASYLIKIKRRILQIWEYPQKAYEKNEEGTVVVKMSLDAGGRLAATNIISSSGSKILDEAASNIVKAAAPFDSLPDNYGVSRLHVIASFSYKLVE